MIRRSLAAVLFAVALLMSTLIAAAERKSPGSVAIDALLAETQQMSSGPNSLDMVWYIPFEFWEAVLHQDPSVSEAQKTAMLTEFESVFMLAIVQADIGVFGNFDYFVVAPKIHLVSPDGKSTPLAEMASVPGALSILIESMKPVLTSATGALGENMTFYVYEVGDEGGRRFVSPFRDSDLVVQLTDAEENSRSTITVELPVDALFIPRICPNGKPAHISWNFCPWDGSEL